MKLHEVSDQVLQKMYDQAVKRVERIDKDVSRQLNKPQTCQDMRDALTEVQKELTRRST